MTHVLITGSTAGIGKAAALAIASGADSKIKTLVVHGRSEARIAPVLHELEAAKTATGRSNTDLAIHVVIGDMSSLDSAASLAEQVMSSVPQLNAVINNAGVLVNDWETTQDGFEKTMGINHVATTVLTLKLLPLLEQNGTAEQPSRVIFISSLASKMFGFSPAMKDEKTGEWKRDGALAKELPSPQDMMQTESNFSWYRAYTLSKLCNALTAAELQRRLSSKYAKQCPVVCASAHPGIIDTQLLGNLEKGAGFRYNGNPVEQGIVSMMHLVSQSNNDIVRHAGAYFDEHGRLDPTPNPMIHDKKQLQYLWDVTVKQWAAKHVADVYKEENGI